MQKPDIDRLYKYQSFSGRALASIIDGVAWFATPASFNDPFDCAITLDDTKIEDSVAHALEQIAVDTGKPLSELDPNIKNTDLQAFQRYKEQLTEVMGKQIGIYCLSANPSDILMWAHYANAHRGFCVEYERTPENSLGRLAQPVVYRDEIPSVSTRDLTGDTSRLDDLWLTKSKHWEYEMEWRLLQMPGGESRRVDFRISGIIFGMRMPESEKHTIKNLFPNRDGIRFRQAVKSADTFSITLNNAE